MAWYFFYIWTFPRDNGSGIANAAWQASIYPHWDFSCISVSINSDTSIGTGKGSLVPLYYHQYLIYASGPVALQVTRFIKVRTITQVVSSSAHMYKDNADCD
jgi:hypothetical protein